MISFNQRLTAMRCGHRLGRREVLRAGSLAGLSLALPQWISARALAEDTKSNGTRTTNLAAKSCILIWLDGGPSHIDTFDPKPDAPREVRGPFDTIATAIPGIRLSELFPELAKRLDQVSLIRSVTSPLGEHNLGAQYMMTGYKPSPVIQYPPLISVLASKQVSSLSASLPRSVAIPNFRIGGGNLSGHGFLPVDTAPFSVESDPAASNFEVRNLALSADLSANRLARRAAFRKWLEEGSTTDTLTHQAFSMLGSEAARQAFELGSEPEAIRQKYGSRTVGQSCLLARRLVEAGVPLVTVVQHGWDTHLDLITRLRDGYTGAKVPVGLGPSLDTAITSLIDDLIERGLYEQTCVVVMGEFGRTPKWNAGGGRDHWPRAFSVLLAGGPFARGAVYGTSDRHGESPDSNGVTPADIAHTLYTAMGIDSTSVLQTPDGRPIRLADERGHAIQSLLTL